jgi:hypothetical protein
MYIYIYIYIYIITRLLATAMVAVGKVQSAKELLVGNVALAYKYKYTKEQIAIDATWEITPVLTLLALLVQKYKY